MSNNSPEKLVKAIHRRTRRKYSAEEKIHIVLQGIRGEGLRSFPARPLSGSSGLTLNPILHGEAGGSPALAP